MSESNGYKSMTARTLELLRDAIVGAHLHPGEKLRIDALGKRFDASPGAVREALSRLTAEGLVLAQPQRGFVVAPISRKDLVDLTEVRIVIEVRCLQESIRHGDLDWEGRVLSIGHQLDALSDTLNDLGGEAVRQWHSRHEIFHYELASGGGNLCWLRLREQLYLQSERYRRLSGPLDETGRDIAAEHRAIAAAALERSSKKASTLIAEHLQITTNILLSSDIPFSDRP